ncbi:MAG: F0F1 ATP synthase subunit gamma [Myxococcales bacterium]|nr:F0F1 ATP synthase subunit gamma [Myxococcales bacterium]
MSEAATLLRRRTRAAQDLRTVVHGAKAIAASSVRACEQAVRAAEAYARTVQQGLAACLGDDDDRGGGARPAPSGPADVLVFGSDQGLVGAFNEATAAAATEMLGGLSAPARLWVVGGRVHQRLADAGLSPADPWPAPATVPAITALVGRVLAALDAPTTQPPLTQLFVVHQRPDAGPVPTPTTRRVLPLDRVWRDQMRATPWPTRTRPETLGPSAVTLQALAAEYLFVTLFAAAAESMASENASRLAAMQRAERSIDERLERLERAARRLRQATIDAELFDRLGAVADVASTG